MKKALLVSLLLILANPVYSQDSEAQQAAIRLMEASGSRESMEVMSSQMVDIQLQQMPALAPYRKVMEEWNQTYLSFDAIKYELAEIYLDHFTLEEITALTEFYETALGKKTVQVLPDIVAQSTEVGASLAQIYAPELEKMIASEAQRIQLMQEAQ